MSFQRCVHNMFAVPVMVPKEVAVVAVDLFPQRFHLETISGLNIRNPNEVEKMYDVMPM